MKSVNTQYSKRFKEFRKTVNLSQKELAKTLLYKNHVSVSNIEIGKMQLSIEKLILLKEAFPELNLNWLFTGEDNMLIACNIPIEDNNVDEFIIQDDKISQIFDKLVSNESILIQNTAKAIDSVQTIAKSNENATRASYKLAEANSKIVETNSKMADKLLSLHIS